ncbi:hypothetical protein PR048_008567, partial [Dryococelus australis]
MIIVHLRIDLARCNSGEGVVYGEWDGPPWEPLVPGQEAKERYGRHLHARLVPHRFCSVSVADHGPILGRAKDEDRSAHVRGQGGPRAARDDAEQFARPVPQLADPSAASERGITFSARAEIWMSVVPALLAAAERPDTFELCTRKKSIGTNGNLHVLGNVHSNVAHRSHERAKELRAGDSSPHEVRSFETHLFLRTWLAGVKHSNSYLFPPRRYGFNPRPGHSGFSHVGIAPDDAVGRRVFSGISRFPTLLFRCCSILTSITLIGSQDLCVEPSKSLLSLYLLLQHFGSGNSDVRAVIKYASMLHGGSWFWFTLRGAAVYVPIDSGSIVVVRVSVARSPRPNGWLSFLKRLTEAPKLCGTRLRETLSLSLSLARSLARSLSRSLPSPLPISPPHLPHLPSPSPPSPSPKHPRPRTHTGSRSTCVMCASPLSREWPQYIFSRPHSGVYKYAKKRYGCVERRAAIFFRAPDAARDRITRQQPPGPVLQPCRPPRHLALSSPLPLFYLSLTARLLARFECPGAAEPMSANVPFPCYNHLKSSTSAEGKGNVSDVRVLVRNRLKVIEEKFVGCIKSVNVRRHRIHFSPQLRNGFENKVPSPPTGTTVVLQRDAALPNRKKLYCITLNRARQRVREQLRVVPSVVWEVLLEQQLHLYHFHYVAFCSQMNTITACSAVSPLTPIHLRVKRPSFSGTIFLVSRPRSAAAIRATLLRPDGMNERGKQEIPEKTRRTAVMRKSVSEPASPWWEASKLTAQPPRPPTVLRKMFKKIKTERYRRTDRQKEVLRCYDPPQAGSLFRFGAHSTVLSPPPGCCLSSIFIGSRCTLRVGFGFERSKLCGMPRSRLESHFVTIQRIIVTGMSQSKRGPAFASHGRKYLVPGVTPDTTKHFFHQCNCLESGAVDAQHDVEIVNTLFSEDSQGGLNVQLE